VEAELVALRIGHHQAPAGRLVELVHQVRSARLELLFGVIRITPTQRAVIAFTEGPTLNYTTVLNLAFLALAAVRVLRFLRTGGREMLRMMNAPAGAMS
jgi:hypothetical protein